MTRLITFQFLNKAQLKLCFVLFFLSSNLSAQSNFYVDSLTNRLKNSDESCEKVITLNKLARAYITIDLEKSNNYSNQGVLLGKNKKCDKELGDLYNTISVIQFYKGNISESFMFADSAIDIHTTINNKRGLAAAIGNKGSFYNNIGKYSEALKLQYQCLRLNEEMSDKSAIATTLTNIFAVFLAQKDYDKALETAFQAYHLFDELGEKDGMAMISYNIALIHSENNQIDSCLFYINLSEKLFSELKNRDGIADSYRMRAEALQKLNQYTEALSFVDKAMVIYDSIGQKHKKIELYQLISSIYLGIKEYKNSIVAATKLMSEGKSQGIKQFEKDGAMLLMQNYYAKGDYKKAFEYNNLYYSLKDEILNETTLNEINRLKNEYEFEQKELQLTSITQQKQILELDLYRKNIFLVGILILIICLVIIAIFIFQKKKLTTERKTIELEQKALRSQMNPHFIFNSLNAIQDMYVGGEMDLANNFMADFGELMRKILDNSGKSKISVKEEIETLRLYLDMEKLRSGGLLSYHINIDKSIDQLNTFLPPLVIQPFIENAVWHGILVKKEKGNVSISLKKVNKKLVCTIEDDGIGFENSMKNKNSDGHESKGIKLTEQRLGFPVKIEELNPGTRITLTISI